MLTLEEFDAAMIEAYNLEKQVARLTAQARRIYDTAIKNSGVYYRDRGPGFSDWSHANAVGWYDTPREALVAALSQPPGKVAGFKSNSSGV
jgi:hypothetical protein